MALRAACRHKHDEHQQSGYRGEDGEREREGAGRCRREYHPRVVELAPVHRSEVSDRDLDDRERTQETKRGEHCSALYFQSNVLLLRQSIQPLSINNSKRYQTSGRKGVVGNPLVRETEMVEERDASEQVAEAVDCDEEDDEEEVPRQGTRRLRREQRLTLCLVDATSAIEVIKQAAGSRLERLDTRLSLATSLYAANAQHEDKHQLHRGNEQEGVVSLAQEESFQVGWTPQVLGDQDDARSNTVETAVEESKHRH
mmetsp:Transcript_35175/g.87618  ORF Transcript_35175/g.87618 Transcript_35175/m.87618 type:complete len:256 (+) Transcript_35175:1020-1787(+)